VVEPTMDPLVWLRKHLEEADTDLLRKIVHTFIQALMGRSSLIYARRGEGPRGPRRASDDTYLPLPSSWCSRSPSSSGCADGRLLREPATHDAPAALASHSGGAPDGRSPTTRV